VHSALEDSEPIHFDRFGAAFFSGALFGAMQQEKGYIYAHLSECFDVLWKILESHLHSFPVLLALDRGPNPKWP